MPTIAELQAQMAAIQKQIDGQKAAGKKQAIAEVIAKMEEFEISVEEIEASRTKSKGKVKSTEKAAPEEKKPKIVKYRMGENTWSGRGLKPNWVKQLEQNGGKLNDYLIAKPKEQDAAAKTEPETLF
jgi:DNA-binding protein H-NS